MLACCVSGEWHACQGGEQARRWSGVGAYRACHSVGSARGRPRRAYHCLSYACVCIARLSVRVPVHGIGELDRPSRVYSDRKYIFCEYLRPFAARGEHAVARACVGKARSFMVSPACTLVRPRPPVCVLFLCVKVRTLHSYVLSKKRGDSTPL